MKQFFVSFEFFTFTIEFAIVIIFTSRIFESSNNKIDVDEIFVRQSKKFVVVFESNSTYLKFEIDFQLINDLLYHVKKNYFKLCISKNSIHDVLKLIHDDNSHVDYHKAHVKLNVVYIRKLSRKLILYIKHCFACQFNQIKRHRSYDELRSIFISHLSYHTIIIDFVLTLFIQTHDFDCMLIVTNKIIRQHLLIQSKIIWDVAKWIDVLLDQLQRNNWNIFANLISNRDFKFCFDFWRTIFDRLNIKLLMNIAYHSQINNLSKRINQTMKIALRFLVVENFDVNWITTLSTLQFRLNNNINAIIDKIFNEIIFDFLSREVIIAIINVSIDLKKSFTITLIDFKSFERDRFVFWKKISNVIFFAIVKIKITYDFRHQILKFNFDDQVYLRLHRDYFLLNKHNFKLSNQRIDSFLIKRRVERLVYEFDLSFQWRIHSIILIAQFEFISSSNDSYHRFRFDHSNVVKIEDIFNTKYEKSYEIKKLVDRRVRTFDRIFVIQYLVRWLNYDKEFDEWKFLSILIESLILVENYELKNSISITFVVQFKSIINFVVQFKSIIKFVVLFKSIKKQSISFKSRKRSRKKISTSYIDKRQTSSIQHIDVMIWIMKKIKLTNE